METTTLIPFLLCIIVLVFYPVAVGLRLKDDKRFHIVYTEIINAYLGIFVSGFLWIDLKKNPCGKLWILFIIIFVYIVASLVSARKRARNRSNFEALYHRERSRIKLYLSFVGVHLSGYLDSVFKLVYSCDEGSEVKWDWGYRRVSVYYTRKSVGSTQIMNLSRICSDKDHEDPSDPVVEQSNEYVYRLMFDRDGLGKVLKLDPAWAASKRGRAYKKINYIAAFRYQITNGIDPSHALILFEFEKKPDQFVKRHATRLREWFKDQTLHPDVKNLIDSLKNIPGDNRSSNDYLQEIQLKGQKANFEPETYVKK